MQKNMRAFIIVVVVILGLIFVSCETKNNPIYKFEDLIEDVRNNYNTYTDSDWERIGQDYNQIMKYFNLYEDQYSEEEKSYISKLHGEYRALITKASINGFIKPIKDFFSPVGSFIEGLKEGWSEKDIAPGAED